MKLDVVVVGYLSIDDITCPAGRFIDVPGGAAYYCAAAAAVAGARVGLVARTAPTTRPTPWTRSSRSA